MPSVLELPNCLLVVEAVFHLVICPFIAKKVTIRSKGLIRSKLTFLARTLPSWWYGSRLDPAGMHVVPQLVSLGLIIWLECGR